MSSRSLKDDSRIVIDDSMVTPQLVASLITYVQHSSLTIVTFDRHLRSSDVYGTGHRCQAFMATLAMEVLSIGMSIDSFPWFVMLLRLLKVGVSIAGIGVITKNRANIQQNIIFLCFR
jgi:hypothetical protein